MVVLEEKVSNNIPDDLAFSILSKLPLKSLKRFECVSKSWSLLLENPYFVKLYRNNFFSKNCSYYDDTSLLLRVDVHDEPNQPCSELYLLSGERFENRLKLDWPPPFQDDDYFIILGSASVNGTLCLSQDYSRKVVLWNPTTEEIKVIPPSPSASVPPYGDPMFCLHGFGYDHIRDDYKVIQWVDFFPLNEYDSDRLGVPLAWDLRDISYIPMWEIYSLRNNSWKELDVKMPICRFDLAAVHMDGLCHWLGANANSINLACLVSFDLGNEDFFTTSMPSDMDDSLESRLVHLVVLNGFIALITNHVDTTNFHISILVELGVKESWTKLFIVEPLLCVEYHHFHHFIGVEKRGNIFLKKKDNELAWLDLNSQMIEELSIKGAEICCCQIVIYKESLLSIVLKE